MQYFVLDHSVFIYTRGGMGKLGPTKIGYHLFSPGQQGPGTIRLPVNKEFFH